MHLVHFGIYLFALVGFGFFLMNLIRYRHFRQSSGSRAGVVLSDAALLLLGYAIFTWSALTLAPLHLLCPDHLQSGFLYLGCGFLLRAHMEPLRWRDAALFGAVLGLAYLAKAPAMPAALLLLGLTFPAQRRRPAGPLRAMVAVLAFGAIASPLVIALSRDRGHLTFGESARLNYAWYVNGVAYRHWQGDGASGIDGMPHHPTRRILEDPPIYEFGGPMTGTYPVWLDPSYWYDGLKLRFDANRQLTRVAGNLKLIYGYFLNPHAAQLLREGREAWLFSPVLVLFLGVLLPAAAWRSGCGVAPILTGIRNGSFLIVPAVFAFTMFSLVWIEARYVACWFVVLAVVCLEGVCLPQTPGNRKLLARLPVLLAIGCVSVLVPQLVRGWLAPSRLLQDWSVAQSVRALRVRRIGVLEYANLRHYRWARLARVQIVAELYVDAFASNGEERFWRADEAAQSRAIQAFVRSGADAIVSRTPPRGRTASEWQPVASYYCLMLPPRSRRGTVGRSHRALERPGPNW